MYRVQPNNVREGFDTEQSQQAYNQGYEAHRLGKVYENPWKRTPTNYDPLGYPKYNQRSWEDELNNWYYNGYYDWQPGDWVPWIAEDQQGEYAINPKTGKSRTPWPKNGVFPKEAWNQLAQATAINLNAVIAA